MQRATSAAALVAPSPRRRKAPVTQRRTAPAPAVFAPGERCAVCGLEDPAMLRVARASASRTVLCADPACRLWHEASERAFLDGATSRVVAWPAADAPGGA